MPMERLTWTPALDAALMAAWTDPSMSRDEAAASLGMSREAAQTRAGRIGLRRPDGESHPTSRVVACLGVGSLERRHTFTSPDPRYQRICPACRRLSDGRYD